MSTEKRPNILTILADDLGYSDIGCYGSEIQTPNLDKLAQEGIRFSDYHTSPLCAPTRGMIMSGTDCHMAGLGVMTDTKGRDPQRWDLPGHEGFLNHDVAALPELLQDAGYHTLMSGKWHLGHRPGHFPHERGFDKSWAMLLGCNNHWGWEPVLDAQKTDTASVPLMYSDEGRRWMPEPNTTQSHDGFYSTTFYTDKLLSYLDERNAEENAKPFFAYLAHSTPHWPLQCFPEDKAKYKGRYDVGPDVIRQERLDRLKKLGVIAPDCEPHPVTIKKKHGWTGNEWDEMTEWERTMSAQAQECYAGMIDKMDQEIGRVIQHLEKSGELDNTLIMFFSDNGAAGAALEANLAMGPRLLKAVDKYYNNSFENLGNHDSFIWLGPRWAQASTAPNRVYKSYTTEGGIRVPLIVRYPKWMSDQHTPGSICRAFGTCMDLMPTFLDMAKAKHPNSSPNGPRDKAQYKGHMVYPMRGKSWLPYMEQAKLSGSDESEAIHSTKDEPVGWEMHGRASLRHGKWKIVNMPADEYGTGDWQLYDISVDQGEVHDLAHGHPDILKHLLKEFDRYLEETGAVFGPPVNWSQGWRADLLADTHGGDPTEDGRAWMRVGVGKRFGEGGSEALTNQPEYRF